MAETTSSLLHLSPKIKSIKSISESPNLSSIPSAYTFTPDPHDLIIIPDTQEQIPTIDYSLLNSGTPDQRSKIIQQLGKACQEWGFFMVTNHGVLERLMRSMIEVSGGFFDLPEEDKEEYRGKHVLDPFIATFRETTFRERRYNL